MSLDKTSRHLWWQTGVIYQIYPRSFQDGNGDGVGDLEGIIQRLDYLSETLGVDAIWLSPFYPSPQADFGYDVANYTDVDPLFGNLATFDRLVEKAHRRNLRIIIDFVPNHTSEQHLWFIESRSSRNNPKQDWYIWRDAKADGSPPNNWLSVFGGPAWEWNEKTRQYYLHSFLKEQPDLNWRNPQVKAAMFDAVRFWLERGVDGFRIDVAHFILKDAQLRDNPPNPTLTKTVHKPLGDYDSQLHHYDKGDPDVHGVLRELRALLNSYDAISPRYSVGEIHLFDWKEWACYYGEKLDELHMPFNFSLLMAPWQAQTIRGLVDNLEAALPEGAWPNTVMGNHDEPRLASRLGSAKARQAAMLLLTLRGTPTLYYGDELGMTDISIPPERQQDPFGIRVPGLGRDGCRTPMQWSDAPHAGFASPDVSECWLPVNPNYREANVERQLADPTSFLNLYRWLLAYRRSTPALQWGSYRPLDEMAEDCYIYLRQAGRQKVLVALNFSEWAQTLNPSAVGTGTLQVSTYMDRESYSNLARLVLRPFEGVVVELDSDTEAIS